MTKLILAQSGNSIIGVEVDNKNYAWLNQYHWTCYDNGYTIYLCTSIKSKTEWMHKLILPVPDGFEVDHRDGIGWHNKESNLRQVTKSHNGANIQKQGNATSQYKGVCKASNTNKYMVRIMVNYQGIYLGLFASEEDAARAYNKAALHYFGEFAYVNKL